MALTLPYPNLDFVPLDILTAEEMNEIVANYTYIANQFPDRLGEEIWALADASNVDYFDKPSFANTWRGYNFQGSGTVTGAAISHLGGHAEGEAGGGVQLTSSAPTGLYLVTVAIDEYAESADGYRPFRLMKNTTAITGDIGTSMRGGSATATTVVSLTSGDIVNIQVYAQGSSRTINARVWMNGYFIKATS